MGLLDGAGLDDPKTLGLLSLAAGLMGPGSFGTQMQRGLAGYQGAMGDASDRQTKGLLAKAQIAHYEGDAALNKAKIGKMQALQSEMDGLFPAGGATTPAAAAPSAPFPGADGVTGDGGGGDGAPASIGPGMVSRLQGMPYDKIVRVKAMGGPDLIEAWKTVNIPTNAAANSYSLLPGQAPKYNPDPKTGLTFDGQGNVVGIPGAATAQARLAYATQDAQERAKAGQDLVDVYDETNRKTVKVPRSQAVQAAGGQSGPLGGGGAGTGGPVQTRVPPATQATRDADIPPILQGERTKAQEQYRRAVAAADPAAIARAQGDIEGVEAEMRRKRIPFDAAPLPAGVAAPAGPMAAGPSAAEQTRIEAERAKATDTAKADVVRDTGNRAENKSFGQLNENVTRALQLLKQDPTHSGMGRMVDSTAAFFGGSTKGADSAARLDTIAGWMTSNVPRMQGPQSDKDVAQYRVMAAQVGNREVPLPQRIAAAEELQRLIGKYAAFNGGPANTGGGTGSWDAPGSAPAGGKTVVRTGTHGGRKVVQYSDGSTEYAN